MGKLGVLLLLALTARADTFYIKVNPVSLFAGGDLVVTCHVPRHAENRQLDAVIVGYTASSRQLDGDAAPLTHRFEFHHIPCDATAAKCVLTDQYKQSTELSQTLMVAGCDPDSE